MREKQTKGQDVPETPQSSQDKVKEITDRLEAGLKALFEGDNFKNYLDTMSKFHNYSFNNTMLIALQKPEATYVAGFNKWKKDFERSVNKGEKGIKIFAPAPYKLKKEQEKTDPETDEPILDKDGNPVMEEVEVTIPAFKVVSVFDVSQTSGKELPTLGVDELKGDVENFEKFFGVLKEVSPVPIKFAEIDGSAKGFYHQSDKDITIKQDMPEVQTIKTAIHEIAHAKLHDRDLRKADIDSPPKDRNTEEVEAESIAYTVCQHFGIDTSDYSFAYVASWGSGKDTPELKSSLETIRSTASELITRIEAKLRELEKERAIDKTIENVAPTTEMQRETVVINAFGGAGAGKTTACMHIAAELKKMGFVAEYVPEYAKELVWDKNFEMLDGSEMHQRMILSEQSRRMERLIGQVDFIVTDAPTLLNGVYLNDCDNKENYCKMLLDNFNTYNNFNFIVQRDPKNFEKEGRIHTLEESIAVDGEVEKLLKDNNLIFGKYDHAHLDTVVHNSIKTYEKLNGIQQPQIKQAPKQEQDKNIIGNTAYKDIENKVYLKIQTSQLPMVEKYLEGAKIQYSGRKTGKTTTITVSEKDYISLCNCVNQLPSKTEPQKDTQKSNIIGNAKYADIPDKFFIRLTAAKAQEIAAVLEKNGIQFSGRIEGDRATLTISKADKDTYKLLTMSTEEIVKKAKASLVEAMSEYNEAEKSIVAAEDNLDRAIQELDGCKDENGEISDPELKEEVLNNFRSAYSHFLNVQHNLSEKEAIMDMAATELRAASSADKSEVKQQETEHLNIPLVLGDYLAERNEEVLEALKKSDFENRQCSNDISKALSDNTEMKEFGVKVSTKKALEQIAAQYPEERIAMVLAAQVIPSRDYLDNPEFIDKRYSPEVRAWAKSTISAHKDYNPKNFSYCNISDKHHPNIVNALTKDFIALQERETKAKYTDRLPDMISLEQMEAYGYKFAAENEMLPLEAERAAQLAELGAEVYRLYEDNTEGLIEDLSEIKGHKGIFGIERAEWEKIMPVVERITALNADEPKREDFLLHGHTPAAAGIYQLTEGNENRDIRFMNSEYLESKGIVPDRDRYTLVYSFEVDPSELNETNAFLNQAYDKFNNEHPDDYMGRSLSVSDVIVIRNGDELSAHYVDSFDFKELENFGEVYREAPQQENKVESVADVEKRMASGEPVNLMDLHKAIKNERKTQKPAKAKAEKKPSILGAIEEIKKNSPQQSVQKSNEKGVER